MLTTITKVSIEKAPKGYSIAVVDHLRDGAPKQTKIMSFAAPAVFTVLEGLKDFPVEANVTMQKKGEFWNWTGVEVGGKPAAKEAGNTAAPAGKVLGSNYETPAERARRQVYIVRQSSISSAIQLLQAKEPKGITGTVKDVLDTAQELEQYVLAVEDVAQPQ